MPATLYCSIPDTMPCLCTFVSLKIRCIRRYIAFEDTLDSVVFTVCDMGSPPVLSHAVITSATPQRLLHCLHYPCFPPCSHCDVCCFACCIVYWPTTKSESGGVVESAVDVAAVTKYPRSSEASSVKATKSQSKSNSEFFQEGEGDGDGEEASINSINSTAIMIITRWIIAIMARKRVDCQVESKAKTTLTGAVAVAIPCLQAEAANAARPTTPPASCTSHSSKANSNDENTGPPNAAAGRIVRRGKVRYCNGHRSC